MFHTGIKKSTIIIRICCLRHVLILLTYKFVISILSGYGECFTDRLDYRGVVNVTNTGNICQRWTSQDPHIHANTPANKPNAGLGDHNYCRNPDLYREGAWCYTTKISTRWELCEIGVKNSVCDGKFKGNFPIKPVAIFNIRCSGKC